MNKYTVVVGGFYDFPGCFSEVYREAKSWEELDIDDCAFEAFSYMAKCNDDDVEITREDMESYELVGIYEGHIVSIYGTGA